MLASSISQGSGAGWPGVLFRGPTWLTPRLRMSSDLRLLILSDSSNSEFICWPARFSGCTLPWARVRRIIVCKRHRSIKWQAVIVVQRHTLLRRSMNRLRRFWWRGRNFSCPCIVHCPNSSGCVGRGTIDLEFFSSFDDNATIYGGRSA